MITRTYLVGHDITLADFYIAREIICTSPSPMLMS